MTSVSSPLPMACHACACAVVGTANAPSNHARVAVEKLFSASPATLPVCQHLPTFETSEGHLA